MPDYENDPATALWTMGFSLRQALPVDRQVPQQMTNLLDALDALFAPPGPEEEEMLPDNQVEKGRRD